MTASANPPPRKKSSQQQLREFAERYSRAWQQSGGATALIDLRKFLPSDPGPLRTQVLQELVKVDLELRWRSHQPVQLETYLATFPELGSAGKVPVPLIVQEFRVRHHHGDKPGLDAYESRFPTQFHELRQLLQPDLLTRPLPTDPERSTSPVTQSVRVPPGPAQVTQIVKIHGGYQLRSFIGEGQFGEVWKAEAPGGVEVAVKILKSSYQQEATQQELQALELIKRLHHPYLLQTQAFWPNEGRLYIVMELAEGSLRGRLQECRKAELKGIPTEELLRHLEEAGEAVDYLHTQRVQHRDIKPENILLMGGHVKLGDFGLARGYSSGQMSSATTSGTPAYMAPEVWRAKISKHSDQFSLAATYAELRRDRRPFPNQDLYSLMCSICTEPPDLAGLPEKEQAVLHKAMAKDPDQRYPSCQAFARALREVLAPNTPSTVTMAVEQRPLLRRPAFLVGAGILTLLLIGMAVALFRLARPPESFQLEVPSALVLATGQESRFNVQLRRERFSKPIQLSFTGGPGGVTFDAPEVAADADQAEVRVAADPLAAPGTYHIQVHGDNGPLHQEASLELAVVFLPANARKLDDELVTDREGKKYYRRIVRALPGGPEVEFILVPRKPQSRPTGRPDPDTFYIMRDKVSFKQFKAFAHAAKETQDSDWREHPSADKPDCPVLQVKVADADAFARWLGGLLPTIDQWDKAAGLFEEGRGKEPYLEGPYRGMWDQAKRPRIAVNGSLGGPLPVGTAADDVSPFGCRDMAGNGQEWTRTLSNGRHEVPLKDPGPLDLVELRGRGYDANKPLQYTDLDDLNKGNTGACPHRETRSNLGFRIVIERPDAASRDSSASNAP